MSHSHGGLDSHLSPRGDVRMGTAPGRWVLVAALLGSGIAGIDATVVNVALPAIGESLDTGFSGLQWTVTAYTLTLAAFILLGGSLADRFGRRKVFLIGIVWFAAASLLCGLAPGIGTLVAARTLQGVGGALLTPGSLALIQATFVPADRARAIGAWSGLSGVATAIGPFLGGFLVEQISWRWVFLINVPLAAIVVVLTLRHVPESRDPSAAPSLDVPGAILGVLALGGVTYALVEQPTLGFTTLPVASALVLGVLASIGFVIVELRSKHPMLPLSIFRSRQFTAANLVTFTVHGGFGDVFFLLFIQLQVVSGFCPLIAHFDFRFFALFTENVIEEGAGGCPFAAITCLAQVRLSWTVRSTSAPQSTRRNNPEECFATLHHHIPARSPDGGCNMRRFGASSRCRMQRGIRSSEYGFKFISRSRTVGATTAGLRQPRRGSQDH